MEVESAGGKHRDKTEYIAICIFALVFYVLLARRCLKITAIF
ncbi:hypothetical protein DSUL_40078 [Desulfovibrionales bacterium]